MKDKKGFTLVELLAVIAILAILVIIALPNVVRMFNEAKKSSFLTEAKTIYEETTKKYISESMKGNKLATISSKDSSKLDMTGEELDYCVILNDQGKVEKIAVGNKSFYLMLSDVKDVNSMTKDDVQEGKLEDMKCSASSFETKLSCIYDNNKAPKEGDVYSPQGQYSYEYEKAGWKVILKDKSSTETINTYLCDTVNGKPITSLKSLFSQSKAVSIDVSSFNTENVTDMSYMFDSIDATDIIGLEKLDTHNVTNMQYMFWGSKVDVLDVSSFDTSNVESMRGMFVYSVTSKIIMKGKFNTNSVKNTKHMFASTKVDELDLSNFDMSNVSNTTSMFVYSEATKGYARTQADADKFNSSSNKPSGLNFVVK